MENATSDVRAGLARKLRGIPAACRLMRTDTISWTLRVFICLILGTGVSASWGGQSTAPSQLGDPPRVTPPQETPLPITPIPGASPAQVRPTPVTARPISPAVPASAEQITQWVKDLNDDKFVVRRNATDRLILAGQPAVQPVTQAVEGANLEVSTRGVFVLRELALGSDVAAQEPALVALQQLATSPTRSAKRLAHEALEAMGDVRQQRAIAQLERLGASITALDRSVGFQLIQALVVEIGPSWEGSVEDLQRLKWLRDVQEITFEGERVTDAWLAPVTHMSGLNRIVLKHVAVTDKSMRTISQLKSLTAIDLLYTPVTDAGLAHLKDMKSVRLIRCYGTKVTRAAVDRFQAEVANVQVDYKVGAFLGVVCQQSPWPCEVLQVRR